MELVIPGRSTDSGIVCSFYLRGICRFGNRCRYVHPNLRAPPPKPKVPNVVNIPQSTEATTSTPSNNTTTTNPIDEVSLEKVCGICFDTILKKETGERVFGILPNCVHSFCFGCIQQWRQTKEFENEVNKSCPECRVEADFVYRSRQWINTKEEKAKFIDNHKTRMSKLDCKYFRKGKGRCRFGNTCFYLHALPDGRKVDIGPPKKRQDGLSLDQFIFNFMLHHQDDDIEDDDDDDDIDEFLFDLEDDDSDIYPFGYYGSDFEDYGIDDLGIHIF